ncbi:MAG: hypothetical protein QHH18_07810 [Candidatus Bathyarchaeota archaeon]|jgi:hypothetical protein|nr:hypothetical protein [Candidatus Bathyarchaeota archaeon A05DMB-5]MDH7558485.1 hypothetical protein [Candidatus Bathyarchaeota archaeon]
MVEATNNLKTKLKKFTFKALKATVKGVIFYVVYFVLWTMFLAQAATLVPGLQQVIEAFVMVYVVLIVIGELTSGTIYRFFFDAAKALFVIGYLIFSLKGGVIDFSFENINLLVDLRVFLSIAILLSLLGLAKSVLGAINFMSEKAEIAYV